jgi:DNA-binding transcriptional MerR regulator
MIGGGDFMTIAEVAKKYDLTPDTLRYYERIGLIPGVSRTSGGIRDYQEEDCRWIEFIKCMRSAGLPVETLIEYVKLFQSGDETAQTRKELLVEQRDILKERISEMQSTLERLNAKIKRYEDVIVPIENELKNS